MTYYSSGSFCGKIKVLRDISHFYFANKRVPLTKCEIPQQDPANVSGAPLLQDEMSTIRVEKNANYSVVSNVPLNDERLSWEARGVIAYLLSKPNNWIIRINDLVRKSPAGEHIIRRVLKELETAGYIERKRHNDKQGKFYWEQTIYETPKTISGFPTNGASTSGEVPYIPNTDLPKADETKHNDATSAPPAPAMREVDNEFASWFTEKRKHPAIQAIKKVWGYYPKRSRALYEGLIEMLGDNPDIPKLEWAYAEAVGAKAMNPMKMLVIVKDGYLQGYYYEVENYLTKPELRTA